jgi:diguanylate cyclase (GGDEF)-like protein/PAS domain S-box-containing protein/excisionase family DNA binding protein
MRRRTDFVGPINRHNRSIRRSMAQDLPEYTIQEAAARLGIPLQKLRRWDVQGVLVARRTDGGHRRYSREIIDGLAGSAGVPTGEKQQEVTKHETGRVEDQLAAARRTLREKRRIIQLLLESESRYRDLVETSHDLIWTTDALGRFTYLNNSCVDLFGLRPKDLLGRCFFDFEARPQHVSNRRFLSALRKNGEVKNYLTHLISTDGSNRWVGINARVMHDDEGRIVGLRGTARNVTDQHNAALEIERLATHDSLTGLPNRVSLQKALESALTEAEKGSVLLLDIDHFKYINDNFGHRAGDLLLVAIGGLLKDLVKDGNAQIFRLGGDEFALHLPNTLRADAAHLGERALAALRHYKFPVPGQGCLSTLTASIGIATYPFNGADAATLLANADIAMYQAKDNGRNRVRLHDQDPDELRRTHRRVHWARELREVLDEDRVVLYSQPVIRLADRKSVHEEILVRILDRNGALILPGEFMEVADSLGMAQEIDLRVLCKVVEVLQRPEYRGRKARFFVNLSRSSISDPDWVRRFQSILAAASVDHSQLVFEITETAAMSSVDVAQGFIAQTKSMGCRFALDDFGAGFSSFYFLKRFDVDYLKIDGSLVRELAADNASRLFVRALCDVASGLSKQVVAEWVEEQSVMDVLVGMGVQFGQGFLFSRPLPFPATIPVEQPLRKGKRA